MPRPRVLLVAAAVALTAAVGAAPAAAAITSALAPGQAELSIAYPGTSVAAFQSGVPVQLGVTYRPKAPGALRRGALAMFPAGARCSGRPTAGDIVSTRVTGAGETRRLVREEQVFPAGSSRVCAWFDEGRGFGRPQPLDGTFVASLWAVGLLSGADAKDPAGAWWSSDAVSTSPLRVTRSGETRDGDDACGNESGDVQVVRAGTLYSTSATEFAAGDQAGRCTARRIVATDETGRAADYAFTLRPGAPVVVERHDGDCLPSLLVGEPGVTAANVRDMLHAVGCKVGRAFTAENQAFRAAGIAPGGVHLTLYHGQSVSVAPAGTPIDVVFDLPEGTPAPDIGPPEDGSAPVPPPPPASDPDDPVPGPGGGYEGAPKPSAARGCKSEVKSGPIVARAACWRTRGDTSVARGRVRLNGIDLTPVSRRGEVRIDRRSSRISSKGRVELRIGPLSLLRDDLDWRSPERVFEIAGAGRAQGDRPKFTVKGQKVFGLPVSGSAKLRLEGGATKLTVTVAIPDEPALRPLQRFAGASGEVTAAATNDAGLVLDSAKLKLQGFTMGFAEVQNAEVAITQPNPGVFHFDGRATVFPFRFSRTGFVGELGFGPQDGYFKAALAGENLNRSIAYGFFLQRIGAGFQMNPFGLTGSAGVTFGPQFRLDNRLISAARLDGSLSYVSAFGKDPAALELSGGLTIAEQIPASDAKVKLAGGTVTAQGTASMTVFGRYGLKGRMSGWFEGARAFNMEGGVEVDVPGPFDGNGEAVLSTRGVGACRYGGGPNVGFGYRWGEGPSLVAEACDLGRWREVRGASARAAQAGAPAVQVRRGTRQLAVRVVGAGGPPRVVFTAPDGRQITAGSGPEAAFVDATAYYAEDPATASTYLVVDAPRAGAWRITAAGGAAITGVQTAAPLPRVRVRARVRGSGATRRLVFRASGLAGRKVTFVETLGERRKVLGTTGKRAGTLRFRPGTGSGRRTIRALVTYAGIPTGVSRTVARYRATARPARPTRVRIARTASTRVVSWRGSRSLRYEVDVRLSDGRRIRRIAPAGRRSVTITTVAPRTRTQVTVRARDARGIASRGASRRG